MSQRKSQAGNRHVSRSGPRTGPQAGNDTKIQQVKLVLLGDQGVGKSSIALRFVRGEYTEHGEATVGAAFLTQTVQVQSNAIKFDIWDTAGQERYHSLAPMYYRGAQAAIVVYDVTNPETFSRAITWITELKQQANPHIVIVLAGNKADQAAETRAVLTEDARAYAEENELIFTETSAKTGMAVQELFLTVAQSLTQLPFNKSRNGDGVKLKSEQEENKKSPCC